MQLVLMQTVVLVVHAITDIQEMVSSAQVIAIGYYSEDNFFQAER